MLTETPEFLSKVREAGYDGLVGYDEGVKYIAAVSYTHLDVYNRQELLHNLIRTRPHKYKP